LEEEDGSRLADDAFQRALEEYNKNGAVLEEADEEATEVSEDKEGCQSPLEY
jgi:hypothetical protein